MHKIKRMGRNTVVDSFNLEIVFLVRTKSGGEAQGQAFPSGSGFETQNGEQAGTHFPIPPRKGVCPPQKVQMAQTQQVLLLVKKPNKHFILPVGYMLFPLQKLGRREKSEITTTNK